METTGVGRGAPVIIEALPSIDLKPENREVIRAVRAVNGAELYGDENQLRFQQDPDTQRMVIRVVNRKTDEVVMQIPDEEVLRIASEIKNQCR